ncbi:uncharacterized protein RJT20DRAFT_46856 [Scheffersomyces xylosifermentans]|uniref:uncharacterized protein n=1 Tax=Scheffersomyces xylosifermentans TaxID=1304137 RepID=UPI00315D3DC7
MSQSQHDEKGRVEMEKKRSPANVEELGDKTDITDAPDNAHQEATSEQSESSWRFTICNKKFGEDLLVFISPESADLHKSLKTKTVDPPSPEMIHAREVQSTKKGVPLLKVISHNYVKKFVSIKKCYINDEEVRSRGFDEEKDMYDFCVVKKQVRINYSTYLMKFTPDPNDRSGDFEVVVFAHGVLPIIDYVYKKERHRWVQEKHDYGKLHDYTHILLSSEQHSLTDNWNKKTNKLDKSIDPNNPLIGGHFQRVFSLGSRKIKDEYYSSTRFGTLEQVRDDSVYGTFQAQWRYYSNYSPRRDFTTMEESIDSVNLDAVSQLCVSLLFKREEDVVTNTSGLM